MTEPTAHQDGPDDEAPGLAEADAELVRTRLATYVDPRLLEVPRWWWPAFGMVFGIFIGIQTSDAGGWLLLASTVLYLAALGGMVRYVTTARGVTGPRLGAMPPALRRTYWPVWSAGLLVFAVLIAGWVVDLIVPAWVIGLGAGLALTGAGLASSAWYRRVAEGLAAAHGVDR